MMDEKEIRKPRNLETRAETEPKRRWSMPSLLPEPTPEPGYLFRWIRVSTMSVSDPKNISSQLGQGWEPVKASTQPHMRMLVDRESRFPDCIEVGGLMLCKIPEELMQQRAEAYQKLADGQMESVDNSFMRLNDARMPVFKERSSSVTFGKGV